jgi:hypothetical protein
VEPLDEAAAPAQALENEAAAAITGRLNRDAAAPQAEQQAVQQKDADHPAPADPAQFPDVPGRARRADAWCAAVDLSVRPDERPEADAEEEYPDWLREHCLREKQHPLAARLAEKRVDRAVGLLVDPSVGPGSGPEAAVRNLQASAAGDLKGSDPGAVRLTEWAAREAERVCQESRKPAARQPAAALAAMSAAQPGRARPRAVEQEWNAEAAAAAESRAACSHRRRAVRQQVQQTLPGLEPGGLQSAEPQPALELAQFAPGFGHGAAAAFDRRCRPASAPPLHFRARGVRAQRTRPGGFSTEPPRAGVALHRGNSGATAQPCHRQSSWSV